MDDFDRFWACYPRHVGKKDAIKAWSQLKPSPELTARILNALVEQAQARARRRQRHQWVPELKHPASWLRGERWEDETEDTPRLMLATAEDLKQFKEDMQRTREARAVIKAAAEDS